MARGNPDFKEATLSRNDLHRSLNHSCKSLKLENPGVQMYKQENRAAEFSLTMPE